MHYVTKVMFLTSTHALFYNIDVNEVANMLQVTSFKLYKKRWWNLFYDSFKLEVTDNEFLYDFITIGYGYSGLRIMEFDDTIFNKHTFFMFEDVLINNCDHIFVLFKLTDSLNLWSEVNKGRKFYEMV